MIPEQAAAALSSVLGGLMVGSEAPRVAALGPVPVIAALCQARWGKGVHVSAPAELAATAPAYDVAVAYEPSDGAPALSSLRALRARLAPGARLVAVSARAGGVLLPWPALELALAEAGFCIESDERRGAVAALCARPTALTVRAGQLSDEAAIRALFTRVFHHDPGRAHWLWRYASRAGEAPHVSVAVDEAGAVLGHWGGDVLDFEVHGSAPLPRVFRAHHNGDVMTDASVRRLGRGSSAVLARVARHFWARFGEGHAALHYGFNTATARAFSLRFVPGVRRFEDVRVWRRCWTAAPERTGLAALAARWRAVTVERVTRWGREWDDFYRRVAPAYGVLARRDAQRLAWRYGARPDHDYLVLAARQRGRLQGWAVLHRQVDAVGNPRLAWGDALVDPRVPGVVVALLDAAAREAVGPGRPVEIAGWFPERPAWWVAELRALGFAPGAHEQDLALVGAVFDPTCEEPWSRAYYTQGDSDLF